MNNNIIDHLQPATKQQTRKLFRFYPTETNTIENPLGVSDDAVEAMYPFPYLHKRKITASKGGNDAVILLYEYLTEIRCKDTNKLPRLFDEAKISSKKCG